VAETGLVLDAVFADERRLDGVQVAGRDVGEPLVPVPDHGLVEHVAVDPDALAQTQQGVPALQALQPVELLDQRRGRGEALRGRDDGEAEVDRQHHQPVRPRVLGDEVVDPGHDTVARPALLQRVAERRVHPAPSGREAAVARAHAELGVGLAVLLGDVGRVVVEVPAAIGPADVVQHHQRHRRAGCARHLGEEPELVADRVPVVVAVDEGHVHRRQVTEDVEAQGLVEDVLPREPALVLRGIEARHRVDDVQLDVGTQLAEHQLGVLAAEGPDLDHPARAHGAHERGDDVVPEREHGGISEPA
jgi:hypothetical protein